MNEREVTQIIDCPVCGKRYDLLVDRFGCLRCRWQFEGGDEWELPDTEISPLNGVSVRQARENYKKGLNVFGRKIKNHKGDA